MNVTAPKLLQPLALERLTRTQVRLAQCLAQQSPLITLELPTGPLTLALTWESATTSDATLNHAVTERLLLQSEAGSLWLALTPTVWQQWLEQWIGAQALDQLPPALRAAAQHAALTPILNALEALLATRLTLMPAPAALDPQPHTESLLALRRSDVASVMPIAWLSMDAASSTRLTARLTTMQPLAPSAEHWHDWPITLTPWLGATRLPIGDWQTLEIGDVLLLPRQVEPSAIPLHLKHHTRTLATAHLASQRLFIDSLVSATMSEHATDIKSHAAPAVIDPDDLEISVEFELSRLHIPLRELRTVQPGYCFELTELDRPRIRLVVNGRLIGYGELVMIETHLGVRVTELFATPPTL